jgi:hypothetical protein
VAFVHFTVRELEPGNGRLLRRMRATQLAMASSADHFRMCYGPEYVCGRLMAWAERQGIALTYIQPGMPQQNAYVERYNRTVRHEWLDLYIFETIMEVQEIATEWLWTNNHDRPNIGTGGITPLRSSNWPRELYDRAPLRTGGLPEDHGSSVLWQKAQHAGRRGAGEQDSADDLGGVRVRTELPGSGDGDLIRRQPPDRLEVQAGQRRVRTAVEETGSREPAPRRAP